MLKKGFTLQELLITIAIIGIVAAVTAPAIKHLMPDEKKVKFMKAYNTLTTISNEIIGDSSYYWIDYKNDGTNACEGLACVNSTKDSYDRLMNAHPELSSVFAKVKYGDTVGITNYEAWNANADLIKKNTAKFAYLFASKLSLQGDIDCTITSSRTSCSMRTTDGFNWTINSDKDGINTVVVDIDSSNGTSTLFRTAAESGNPQKVDTFRFEMSKSGEITIPDSEYLSKEYLKNPTDMHRAKKDFAESEAAYKKKLAEDAANNNSNKYD